MEIEDNNLQNDIDIRDVKAEPGMISIPVIHENVTVSKKIIETREIKILKKVNEENEVVAIPLEHEEIDIQTIPINKYIDDIPPPVRYEGDTMIIPVLKEVTVIRLMLEKEIHITKKKVVTRGSKTVTLRKEEIIIEDKCL